MSDITETQRRCYQCKLVKNLTEFYKYRSGKLGYNYYCKPCNSLRAKVWYYANREKILEKKKIYSQSINGKKNLNANAYRMMIKHPEKHKARTALHRAVKLGKVKKLPCYCGNTKSEAHHHKGYDYPLDVQWLCKQHHFEAEHGNLDERQNKVFSEYNKLNYPYKRPVIEGQKYISADVLASRYRLKKDSFLIHVYVEGDEKTLCNRMLVENLADGLDPNTKPTCDRCLRKDIRNL